jgi:4-amino-4-deoxy-L-arabinose transferase-like glycosyltransferase
MTALRDRIMESLRSPSLLGLLLGVLTVLVLLRGERQIGYVRDEGVYFEASRHYAAWVVRWLEEGGEANTPEIRDRYFGINHEHPALMKLAAGLSARLLAEPPVDEVTAEIEAERNARKRAWRSEIAVVDGGRVHVLREGAAMRLPAILLAGLAATLLFGAGRRLGGGTLGGLLAVGCFVLLPHVAFHASLHAFDVPIAVMTLIVALAWLRALSDWRWGLALGPLLGIAIAVKHNALFLGPLLALHLWLLLALRWRHEGERPRLRQVFALPLWSMALLGPLVAWLLWPWMWHDTFARVSEYFAFHSEHSYYNMEFLGRNFNRPPLPISYPFVMTWATVPSAVLLLVAVGVVLSLRTIHEPRALRHLGRFGDNRQGARAWQPGARARRQGSADPQPRWVAPLPTFDGREEPLLYIGLATFPLALIALPSVPIFGGTKHWLTAYPFFALLAAMAWGRLWWRARTLLRAWPKLMRFGPPVVLIAVLGPGSWATVHGHPFNLSQYAPLAGGARGAAALGLNRGFWGHAVVPLLDAEVFAGERVYVHDVHKMAVEQYRREGRWPGWRVSGVERADAALLFPEMHMLGDEIAIWESFGTVRPTMVLTLDDVPITIVYERPR